MEKRGEPRSYFLSEELENVQAWVANGGKKIAGTATPSGDPTQRINGSDSSDRKERQEFSFQTVTRKFISSMNRLILGKEDWSASSDKFRICVAAVEDDVDKVVSLMPNIVDKDIDKDDFRDWPAFQSMTGEQKFVQAFERKFGEPFMPDRDSQDETATFVAATPILASPSIVGKLGGNPNGEDQKKNKKTLAVFRALS